MEKIRHILGVSGKDSASSAVILKLHHPDIWDKTELFFSDTGCDYPVMNDWLSKVEENLGKPILRISGDLPSIISRYTSAGNSFLPSPKARYCTRESKIIPMEQWLNKDKAVLYTGLRVDEQDRAGYTPSPQIAVRHPLIEHSINLGGVYAILDAVKLLPPDFFWQTLYDAVCDRWSQTPNIFGETSFESFLSLHQKRILFAGRSRANCYFCFNQRLYEFVWLSETYPELFEKACSYEKENYTWIKGQSLRDLVAPARKAKIIEDRANYVFNQVSSIVFGVKIDYEVDLYSGTSCGLFCGK
jgi:hypothetical protein